MVRHSEFRCALNPPLEESWSAWPINNAFIVRAVGPKGEITAAAASDPWWAAAKCAGFMLERCRRKSK